MDFKDVIVTITRETSVVTQAGFGLPLILATSKALEYKEYIDITQVAVDFAEATAEYKLANAILSQIPRPEKIAIHGVLYDNTTDVPTVLTNALNTLINKQNNWYFLLCPEQGDEEITALSGWVDTQKKLYFASTNSLTLAATLQSDRTVLMYHTAPDTYPAEAWVGRCAPEDPGSITWKFKNLKGINPVDIGSAELKQLHLDGGNTYIAKMGVNSTSEGIVTSGEYIDVMRSQDWLEARMAEAVQRLLLTTPKVPYDNSGIALVVAEVENVLKQALTQEIIARDADGVGMYTVDAPDREEIPAETRAQRVLPGVEFTAVLAGAVHEVRIVGTLQV